MADALLPPRTHRQYNNGLCFYKAGLFSEIWQFLPRCIVFLVISILYVRLFVFLRRPDKIRSSTSLQGGSGSSTTGGQSTEVATGGRRWSRWRFGSRSSGGFRTSVSADQPSRWAGFTGRTARGSDGSNDQRRSRTEREPSAGGPKDLSLGLVRTSVSQPMAAGRPLGAPQTATTQFQLDSARSSVSALGGSAAPVTEASKKKRDIPAWEKLELPDYSRGLGASGEFSPPLSPRTLTTTKRGSVSGWKWGMGASQSFGGVEGEDMVNPAEGPTPSQLPRRSTLAPLKIPLPAPPAQPALRRTPSFANANAAAAASVPPPAIVASSSRRPSAQGSDGESAGAGSDGRLLDFPFASLRRGSHVSFSFADGPSTNAGTPSNARTHTPPPTLPELPQTFGGPEPGQSISSTVGGSGQGAFSGYSFASQGTMVQAPLLSSQQEAGESDLPAGLSRHRFSDTSTGSGVDPRTPLVPPSIELPPIVLAKDFGGDSSSAETSNATTSDTRRDSAATGASEKGVEFVGVKRLLSDFQEDGVSPGRAEDGLHVGGGESDDEGVEYSLAKILECSAPPDDYDYYDGGMGSMAHRGEGSSGEVGSGTGSGSDGRNQESMSKFMNRKVRTVCRPRVRRSNTLTRPSLPSRPRSSCSRSRWRTSSSSPSRSSGSSTTLRTPSRYPCVSCPASPALATCRADNQGPCLLPLSQALSAVSRWLVFSQGLVDARESRFLRPRSPSDRASAKANAHVPPVIYGIIEWRVKRTVRRRTRKIQSASGGEDSRGGVTGSAGVTTVNRGSHSTTFALRHGNRPSQGASSLP